MSMHRENKNKEGIAGMRILDREVFSKYTGILTKIITAITTNLGLPHGNPKKDWSLRV